MITKAILSRLESPQAVAFDGTRQNLPNRLSCLGLAVLVTLVVMPPRTRRPTRGPTMIPTGRCSMVKPRTAIDSWTFRLPATRPVRASFPTFL